MSGTLIERLEAISGYQPVFSPNDPSAALNPIAYSHLRVSVGGKALNVVSRIGPAGLDYSGRPNKYAHHIVLEGDERPDGGPAWLLSQPGFVQAAWDGEPREVALSRTPPQGDRKPGVARTWQLITDDAGWAGTLAETFLADPKRPVFLVFRPGMDLLPLFEEALALLPLSRRWEVDFSTYFSQLPQGISCAWRGVLEGSEESIDARRLPNALMLDLCSPLGRAGGGALVHMARTGERREPPDTRSVPLPSAELGRNPLSADIRQSASAGHPAEYKVIPGLAANKPVSRIPPPIGEGIGRRKRPLRLVAIVAGSFLILFVTAALFLGKDINKLMGFNNDASQMIADVKERLSIEKQTREELAHKTIIPAITMENSTSPEKETTSPQLPQLEKVTKVEKSEEAPQKKKNSPVTKADSKAVTMKPQQKESIVLAFPLPPISVSAFDSAPNSTPHSLDLRENVRENVEILNAVEFEKLKLDMDGSQRMLRIVSNKISQVGGGVALAHFKLNNNKILEFSWEGNAGKQQTLADALKDAVLRFETEGGDKVYVVLRSLVTDSLGPLNLINKTNAQNQGDSQVFIQTAKWAKPDALDQTRWKLGIRRWRLVVSPASAGGHLTPYNSKPIKERESFLDDTEEHQLSDDVRFKLKVHPDKPSELQAWTWADVSEAGRNELADLTSKQAELSKLDKERSDQKVSQLMMELDDIRQKIDNRRRRIHDLLFGRFELSVVIGLKIDDKTILDIAKIGDFANSP
jgi:hypothetical protein